MKKLYMLEKNKEHFWVCKYANLYTIDRITSEFGGTVKAADALEEIEKYAVENGFILLKSSIMNICDIKPALEKLEALEAAADAAEEEMMNDIMDASKEKAFDEAYKAQYS